MNDFTKEELQEIQKLITPVYWSFSHNGFPPGVSSGNDIMTKLQSMIDTYCDQDCSGDGECLTKICDRCARMT
jgi:hypothetical protein